MADLLSDQGFEYTPDGQHHAEPLPPEVVDEEHRRHDELVEEIVSGDDEQLERYLSGDTPLSFRAGEDLAHEVLHGASSRCSSGRPRRASASTASSTSSASSGHPQRTAP